MQRKDCEMLSQALVLKIIALSNFMTIFRLIFGVRTRQTHRKQKSKETIKQ